MQQAFTRDRLTKSVEALNPVTATGLDGFYEKLGKLSETFKIIFHRNGFGFAPLMVFFPALFVAALLVLPVMSRRIGKAKTHMTCLLLGAAGFLGYFVLRDPNLLIVCEILKGIAWASILAMPYAILASSLPQAKLGIYMGLFNIFIVVPQLLVATVMGSVMNAFFPGEPIWTMLFAAASWTLAGLAMLRVTVPGEGERSDA